MKFVSEGNKSKADVLATSLQLMEACFLDVSSNYLFLEVFKLLLITYVLLFRSSVNPCNYVKIETF